MEDTPAAAAPATEANPTNTNDAPANAAPETPPADTAPKAAIPDEQIEAFNKFVTANGGFDKAFENFKKAISNQPPKATQTTEQAEPATPAPAQPEAPAQPDPYRPAEGYITQQEITALQYNNFLADAYPELKEYISKGEYIKEAGSLGITVVDNHGNMNDRAIRQFLDLKKQAIQPKAPSEPITPTPTVTYQQVEGDIDTKDKAMLIMQQGPSHPQYKDAVVALKTSVYGKKEK